MRNIIEKNIRLIKSKYLTLDRFASLFKKKQSETDIFLSGLRSTAERQNPRPRGRGASLHGSLSDRKMYARRRMAMKH
ncbi:MAG: hypothetical protein PVI06_21460 [Desulfobacterales bacterium]|jgi:hypothetical protein